MDNNSTSDKLSEPDSKQNVENFTHQQKSLLILANIAISIIIVVVLQVAGIIQAPLLQNQKISDVAPLVKSIILFMQFFLIVALLPLNIYDISKNKYVDNIKQTQKYILIISVLGCLLLMVFLFTAASSIDPENIPLSSNLYLGPPPEILISALLFSVVLYNLPGYTLMKYYKLNTKK